MDEVRKAFKLFDDEGTGKISLRNLRRVTKELQENLDDEELCVCCLQVGNHCSHSRKMTAQTSHD